LFEAWLAVAQSPNQLIHVLRANKAALDADQYGFAKAMLLPGTKADGLVQSAVSTALAWANQAGKLLSDDELSVNGAHNKVKHGLAVSTRGDVRIELVAGVMPTNGEVPLSILQPVAPCPPSTNPC